MRSSSHLGRSLGYAGAGSPPTHLMVFLFWSSLLWRHLGSSSFVSSLIHTHSGQMGRVLSWSTGVGVATPIPMPMPIPPLPRSIGCGCRMCPEPSHLSGLYTLARGTLLLCLPDGCSLLSAPLWTPGFAPPPPPRPGIIHSAGQMAI